MTPAAFDLEKPETRQLLSRAFTEPERLPKNHRERVTQEASRQVASHYGRVDKG